MYVIQSHHVAQACLQLSVSLLYLPGAWNCRHPGLYTAKQFCFETKSHQAALVGLELKEIYLLLSPSAGICLQGHATPSQPNIFKEKKMMDHYLVAALGDKAISIIPSVRSLNFTLSQPLLRGFLVDLVLQG